MVNYFIKPPTINQKEKCVDFAKQSVSSSFKFYSTKRNQSNLFKIMRDIYIGKCAEFSFYNLCLDKNLKDVSEPDTNIYYGKDKSFECDILVGALKFHIKSYYPSFIEASWVFDPFDPLIKNPSDKDYIALCHLNKDGSGRCYVSSALSLLGFYKEPYLNRLKGKKKCIYLKDLQ